MLQDVVQAPLFVNWITVFNRAPIRPSSREPHTACTRFRRALA